MFVTYFPQNLVLSTLPVELNLTNGIIKGASNFVRAGNFYLRLLPSTVRLHGLVKIDRLHGTFNYTYSSSIFENSGILNTTVENVTAIIEADFSLNQLVILNPLLKIKHIGWVILISYLYIDSFTF